MIMGIYQTIKNTIFKVETIMNKLAHFKKMHTDDDIFILPNAWDLLSALVLEQSGFKAIGTTSWGVANAMGYTDGEKISFEQLLTLTTKMVSNVTIPVTVDIESGYSDDISVIADNALKIAEAGAAGINVEDSLIDGSALVDVAKHCKTLEKIRSRLDNNGYADFFINARTDTYFQLENPLAETLSRSTAYINSGVDGIFVPGLSTAQDITAIVEAIKAPLNVMSLPKVTDAKMLQELGVKRFSTGPAFSNTVINFIERKSSEVLAKQNTESLYKDCDVKTIFK